MALDRLYLNNPPPGFQVTELTDDSVVLRYKQPMMGCALVFLVAFAVAWLSASGFFLVISLASGVGAFSLCPMLFFGLGLFGLAMAVRFVLTTYVLRIEPEALTVSTGISQQTIAATVGRRDISRVFVRLRIVQRVNSMNTGTMSSYSRIWSVVAYTPTAVQVLPSAGREQCEWLGNLLGEWAECLVETDN